MTIFGGKLMRENELSVLGKFFFVGLLAFVGVSSAANIYNGHVPNPMAFVVVLAGFMCFLIAKASIIFHKKKVSFGCRLMSENIANLYRLGYWLMVVGVLLTFVG